MLAAAALLVTSLGREPLAASFAEPFAFAPAGSPLGAQRTPIRGAFRLAAIAPDGQPVHGLSGAAWSAARGLLYAVSDQGYLVHLRPVWAESRLVNVLFVARYPLLDARGKALRERARDAEGLVLRHVPGGRETLLVSFEQQPRIMRYTPTGELLGKSTTPNSLTSRLHQSHRNHGLEALAWTPRHGLIMGLEYPLPESAERLELIAANDDARWRFAPAEPGGALVGLDSAPDSTLIVLERRYLSPLAPLIITLRKLDLSTTPPGLAELARFSSADGWPVDNFEAVARHANGRYFLLSDDNASPLQKTLLVYLALPGAEAP